MFVYKINIKITDIKHCFVRLYLATLFIKFASLGSVLRIPVLSTTYRVENNDEAKESARTSFLSKCAILLLCDCELLNFENCS